MRHNRPMTSNPVPALQDLSAALVALGADAQAQDWPAATLYVVATPIGNRADVTVRALAALAKVDAVAAEDTRMAGALLAHYGLNKPLIAAHRHNEAEAATRVVTRLSAGERVAYVSDAGTPGVSDPGARLVAAVRAAGHRVVPLPGASALTTTLSVAGLPDADVLFAGFLPAKAAQAEARLRALAATSAHLLFYEAPHRIVATLELLAALFPEREIVVARELTKRFETIHRGPAAEVAHLVATTPDEQRGEFAIVVAAPAEDEDAALGRALPILERLLAALSVSEAAALAAELTGVPRKVLYAEALKRRDAEEDEGAEGG
jgi:16S rRNA (cytidine1402-2'-O)-methyltransferase